MEHLKQKLCKTVYNMVERINASNMSEEHKYQIIGGIAEDLYFIESKIIKYIEEEENDESNSDSDSTDDHTSVAS